MPASAIDDDTDQDELIDTDKPDAKTGDEDNGNGPTAAELAAENDAKAKALKQVAGDEAEDEGEPEAKRQRIPKSRFDEVNNERKTLADPLTQAIQRLNANPYSLTKSECIDVLDKLRAELGKV